MPAENSEKTGDVTYHTGGATIPVGKPNPNYKHGQLVEEKCEILEVQPTKPKNLEVVEAPRVRTGILNKLLSKLTGR